VQDETNVTPTPASSEPAKTAQNISAGELAAAERSAPLATAGETAVSYPDHHHDVAQIDHLESRVVAIVEEQVSTARAEIEDIRATLRAYIDETKADLMRYFGRSVTPIGPGAAETIAAAAFSAHAHVLAVGDPVRIYKDAEHKTFYTGTVTALHEGGNAADVSINELEGALTTARLDSLEYDDRA
jgi:hypothetical protein